MKNQLSKREYKYRCKIIAENHLKKELQKYLDSYVDSKWLTYKDVYLNKVVLLRIKAAYNFQSVSKAMSETGVAMKQAADAFNSFACVANAVSEAVKIDGIITNMKNVYKPSEKQIDELLKLAKVYAERHIITCEYVLYEVERKIREDGYTIQRCIEWLKEQSNGLYV